MKHFALISAFALAATGAGCAQDNRNLEKKIDDLSSQVASLKGDIAKVGAAAGRPGAAQPGQPQRPARPQPDPAKTYAISIDGDPFEGPADAKVTIVKAYDYGCPFCSRVRPTMDELRKKYGDDVRIVHKQFVVHPQVEIAHLAACAAHRQGKFLEMDKLLWEKAFETRQYDDAHIADLAKEAGLDTGRFAADIKSPDCKAWLQKDQGDLQLFGVGATPSFFVNGRFVSGAQPLPAFTQLVDEELKKANDRLAAGTPAADYYKTWIMDKGEKKLAAPDAPVAPTGGTMVVKPK
jgi:protein-disulfide isomerase